MSYFRTLLIAALTALAITATVGVASASANKVWVENGTIKAESYPVTVSDPGYGFLSLWMQGSQIVCDSGDLDLTATLSHAVPSQPGEELTLEPTVLSQCTTHAKTGSYPTTVDFNGCTLKLKPDGKTEWSRVRISCTGAENAITIDVLTQGGSKLCTLTVPDQAPFHEGDYGILTWLQSVAWEGMSGFEVGSEIWSNVFYVAEGPSCPNPGPKTNGQWYSTFALMQ